MWGFEVKEVRVIWDEIYGPVPLFEDESKGIGLNRKIEVENDVARRWKRVKKQYMAMLEELEDLVPR